jgi:hypothetical protein
MGPTGGRPSGYLGGGAVIYEYPLNDEEFAAYRQDYPDAQPFPWQCEDG